MGHELSEISYRHCQVGTYVSIQSTRAGYIDLADNYNLSVGVVILSYLGVGVVIFSYHSVGVVSLLSSRSHHGPDDNFIDGGFGELQTCYVFPLHRCSVVHDL